MAGLAHLSVRVLLAGSFAHPGVKPAAAVVAGSTHANTFARCVLYALIQAAHEAYGPAAPHEFVDDLAQCAIGARQQVFNAIVDSGISLAASLAELRLEISPKSTVVASCPKLRKSIVSRLAAHGFELNVAAGEGRDLGVGTTAGKVRRTGIQSKG
eukprot:7632903-Alexandrium_andersonii.AAC.1